MNKKSFNYDGRDLEVIAITKTDEIEVFVSENGKKANYVSYYLKTEDLTDSYGFDILNSLMNSAQNDFIAWSDWGKNQPKDNTDE